MSIKAGDILNWTNTAAYSVTVALDDGNAAVRLIEVSENITIPTQLFDSVAYRVYKSSGDAVGSGTWGQELLRSRPVSINCPRTNAGSVCPCAVCVPKKVISPTFIATSGPTNSSPGWWASRCPVRPRLWARSPSWELRSRRVSATTICGARAQPRTWSTRPSLRR